MNHDPERLLRRALSPGPEVLAPAGLAESIRDLAETTPQHRGLTARLLPRSNGLRLVLSLAVLVLLLVASILLAGALRTVPTRGVLGYHGPPQRTGVMPGPGPSGPVAIRWDRALAGPVAQTTTTLAFDGVVYVPVRGSVAMLDEQTGAILRTIEPPDGASAGSLAISDGLLIDGTDTGLVVAWDLHRLSVAWTWRSPTGEGLSLAAADGSLVATSLDGRAYGLDPANGTPRWTLDAGGQIQRSAALDGQIGVVAAAVGRVTAFDVLTGAIRWSAMVGGTEVATPAIAGGTVYVASGVRGGPDPYVLTALDLAGGAVLWRWSPPTTSRMFVGAVEAPSVYAVSEDDTVYRIDSRTGDGGPFYQAGGPIGALPSIVWNVLYVASGDRNVAAVDRATGMALWTVPVGGLPSAPAVLDGLVIVGTDVGHVIAVGGAAATGMLDHSP